MKKILFTIVLLLVFICDVKAFNLDMEKVNVTSRSDKVIDTLDKKYNIELDDFYTGSSNDLRAINFTKRIVNISFSNKSKSNIKKELTNYLYISNDDGFETLSSVMFLDTYLNDIEKNKIVLGEISDIRTANFNQDDVMSFVYVKDASINGIKKDIVLSYWLKKDSDSYKVFYPWIGFNDAIDKYFEEINYKEETGKILGDSYNKLSLDGNSNVSVSDDKLLEIYNSHKDNVLHITFMSEGVNNYASGFYLREGIVVTTWSLLKEYLTNGNFMYVSDVYGNTYDVEGIVSADTKYDVVIFKLSKEVGKKVTLGNSNEIYSSSKLFTINSKYNNGFSINYGTNISYDDGKYKNMFALSSSDIGSALFNEYGEVVGFNVGDKLYSELSYANSTDYLKGIQRKLSNTKFEDIKYTKLDSFKENYYVSLSKEKRYVEVDKNIWNKYKTIGNIEKNITLDLVKSSYKDGILSLRYNNDATGMLDSIYLASSFTEELINNGYELTFYNDQKYIYKNDEYQVILKDNFTYLIVLVMEI